MLLRVPSVLKRRLLGLQKSCWAGSFVPRRVLLLVHARSDGGTIAEADMGHVRLSLHPLHPLGAEVPVTLGLALRIELSPNSQIILSNDPLRTFVGGRRPRVSLLGAAMQGGETTTIAALARVADVLTTLR